MKTSIDQLKQEFRQHETTAREILDRSGGQDLADDDAQAFDQAATRMEALRDEIRTGEERAQRIRKFAADHPDNVEAGTTFGQPGTTRPATARDAAMRVLEARTQAGDLPDHAAARVETLMKAGGTAAQGFVARWTAAAGDPDYASAFARMCADPDKGHLLWSPAEAAAFRRVAEIQSEQRAMGESTGPTGGYMVPLVLDPAILLTSDGSTNPLRKISRVVQTTGSQWAGVTSAGVTAEWTAEADEVSDASPVLAQPNVPVHKGDAFVPFSFEVGDDAPNFVAELQILLVDAADQLQAEAFTNGSGTGQPTGLVTKLAATPGSIVAPTTSGTFSAADIFKVQNALPPRWQPRARWTANLETVNAAKQFETTNGSLKFPEIATGQLLGRALNENSAQDTTASTLVYGDFAAGYVIADRIGTTLEVLPHLLGANRRPTLERGALLWFRSGADVVVPQAFRLLKTATTAGTRKK
ncbi:phage major capsid protein [Rhodococcus koreensis]|uniref:phage major capsid protein n=1 Tax=Rhodococcus koreensis TaxID=99653 RepID=UPI0036DDEE23